MNNLLQQPKEFEQQSMQTGEQNFNYYHEYCRLFIANVVLTNQMKELVTEKDELYTKLNKLEKKSQELGKGNEDDDKKKRVRRVANQITRHYKCPIEQCKKSYGSEASLNQHIKLKHPEIYTGSDNIDDSKSSVSGSDDENNNNIGQFENNQESQNQSKQQIHQESQNKQSVTKSEN